MQAWAKGYGDLGLPSQQNPSLGLTSVVQREAELYVWHLLCYMGYWQGVEVYDPTTFGAPLQIFPRGLLLKPFPWVGITARQWGFVIRVPCS